MRRKRLFRDVTIDQLQFYVSNNVILIPILNQMYIDQLKEEERRNHLCLTPKTLLELYNMKFGSPQ